MFLILSYIFSTNIKQVQRKKKKTKTNQGMYLVYDFIHKHIALSESKSKKGLAGYTNLVVAIHSICTQ